METWKPIPGWEDSYEVSDQGNVRSIERKARNRNGHRTVKARLLKQSSYQFGHPMVTLNSPTQVARKTVYRIMYEAFNGPIPKGSCVQHINSDRTDCRLENLKIRSQARFGRRWSHA